MLCSEFESRLQKLLDERRAPELDTALLGHARQCDSCRDRLAVLTRLLGSLDLLEVPRLSEDFAQRVVDSVTRPSPRKSGMLSRDPSFLVALAISLTLLLAAVPVVWQAAQRNRSVAQPTVPPPASTRSPDRESVDPNYPATGESWLVSTALFEFYPEATRERHRQQVNQIADDLKPIATPFNATVTAIRRSIPGTKSENKGEPRASIRRHDTAGHISSRVAERRKWRGSTSRGQS